MNEQEVIDILKSEGVDLVASLPCDRNKCFTSMLYDNFQVVDLTREEDGVGISAGAFMGGMRPIMSIQSSGLGNMMNALMSLTSFYGFPLPILASWRGVDNENIEAQKAFNLRIPQMLEAFGIRYAIIKDVKDMSVIGNMIRGAFEDNAITVILIYPSFWGSSADFNLDYPSRVHEVSFKIEKKVAQPTLTRLKAIGSVMSCINDDDIVVSNIGVPSKEVFASKDRNLNFYMLGSYTQATPIGIGLAISTKRHVYVIDGDGSLLGSSVLPVVASMSLQNLTIICLDNGTYGSTGNQINQAYSVVDMESVAKAYGIRNTSSVSEEEGIVRAMRSSKHMMFIQIMIIPFNSKSPNISYSADEIKRRFIDSI